MKGCGFGKRKANDEFAPFAEFAFGCDCALENGDHLPDISQSESESLDVMTVAGGNSVEFVEDPFDVFLADSYSVVADAYFNHVAGNVIGADYEMRRRILLHVFDCVVEEIEYDIREMHLIEDDVGVDGVKVQLYGAAVLLGLQLMGVDDVENYIVDVYLREFHCASSSVVIHRHLEHFLHLETQTLRLFSYYVGQMLQGGRRFPYRLVVKHLGRK